MTLGDTWDSETPLVGPASAKRKKREQREQREQSVSIAVLRSLKRPVNYIAQLVVLSAVLILVELLGTTAQYNCYCHVIQKTLNAMA